MDSSWEALCKVADACERHYRELVDGGCDEDVAADRIFDALRCATEHPELHCFDRRDRALEYELRGIYQKTRSEQ